MANNLSEYYKSIGQALPSLSDRAKIYESLGLGSASSYRGTAAQNSSLLNKLSSGGGSSGGSSTPASSGDTSGGDSSLDTYLQEAQSVFNPGYDALVSAISEQGKATQASFEQMRTQTLNREPLVRQTYANLAAEVENTYKESMAEAQQTAEQNIGSARASLAAAGVENAQGSFAAPITAAQNEAANRIQAIADKHNIDAAKVTDALNSSVQDLYDKADQYKMQGNQAWSDTLVKLADLQRQHETEILQYAKAAESAQLAAEKEAWNEYITERRLEQESQRLDVMMGNQAISERRLELESARADASQASSLASKYKATKNTIGGYSFTDPNGLSISAAQFAMNTGKSLTEVLSGSGDPDDKKFLSIIKQQKAKGLSDAQITNMILNSSTAWKIAGADPNYLKL